jgi:hypothetical protein
VGRVRAPADVDRPASHRRWRPTLSPSPASSPTPGGSPPTVMASTPAGRGRRRPDWIRPPPRPLLLELRPPRLLSSTTRPRPPAWPQWSMSSTISVVPPPSLTTPSPPPREAPVARPAGRRRGRGGGVGMRRERGRTGGKKGERERERETESMTSGSHASKTAEGGKPHGFGR